MSCVAVLAVAAAVAVAAAAGPAGEPDHWASLVGRSEYEAVYAPGAGARAEALAALLELGVVVDDHDPARRRIVVYASVAEAEVLEREHGLEMRPAAAPLDAEVDAAAARQTGFAYHNYVQLTAFLEEIAAAHPTITRLFSAGQSRQGRELWVLEISDAPGVDEAEPYTRYIANMHGDETVGRELVIHLIEDIVTGHANGDPRMVSLVESQHVFLMASMNPDGFESRTRANANGADLNRSFWDQYAGSPRTVQPEVAAVVDLIESYRFVLTANFHGGALVASYPFDGHPNGLSNDSPTPHDATFRHLAAVYADNHPTMAQSTSFPGGITNGADWYALTGGMQDYNYLQASALEITLEVSQTKNPSASQLQAFYAANKESMLAYLELATTLGVRGVVRDESGAPLAARITAEGISTPIFTKDTTGDYTYIVVPGSYKLTAAADLCAAQSECVVVQEGEMAVVDFVLDCSPGVVSDSDSDDDDDDDDDDEEENSECPLPGSGAAVARPTGVLAAVAMAALVLCT